MVLELRSKTEMYMIKSICEHVPEGKVTMNFVAVKSGNRTHFYRVAMHRRLVENGFLIPQSNSVYNFRRMKLISYYNKYLDDMKAPTPFYKYLAR